METKNQMVFDRQYQIFDPKEQKTNIIVVGCGSIGSFVTLTLAKLGFDKITALDFDKVEKENIPNQFYRFCDIGKYKVDAIKEITKDFSGLDITTINTKIDENNKFLDKVVIDLNTLVILALDNIEARKLIYNELKELPIKILDVRVGGEASNIYLLDLENEKDKSDYEALLEKPASEDECGNKFVIYNILNVASETCNIVKRLDKGEPTTKVFMRTMANYRIISS